MKIDYKNTLCLPQTTFPMKADLPNREKEFLKFWEEHQIYKKLIEKNKEKGKFLLHDGPPYANGNIHIGHALNKILKDIIIKSKNMMGFEARFLPGWDCHGLPIELQVDKKLGSKKREKSKLEIRKLCREYAEKYVEIQREEFKRLGVFGEWQNPYLTMSPFYEAMIVEEFFKMVKAGYVYREKKPVYWCIHCETALAEAEVEYDEHTSPSIYVAFPLPDAGDTIQELKGFDVSIVIWTTTPWTIPANRAIALHPDFEYAAVMVEEQEQIQNGVKIEGRVIILAKELVQKVMKELLVAQYSVLATLTGRQLADSGLKARHPIYKSKDSLLVTANYVSKEEGTGCVHTAPGHGEDDYWTGKQFGLEVFSPVDSKGRFTSDAVFFEGENVFQANEKVIAKLKEMKALLKSSSITHSYPHCWRCKKPVIFRATEQWFISVNRKSLRQNALREISENVTWIPHWGRSRIEGMIAVRPDWCISRQRAWGVPIIAFYCKKCNFPIDYPEEVVNKKIVEEFKKHGADYWFETPVEDILPAGTRCKKCNSTEFKKEEDILDVWFDSGVSHAVVLENTPGLKWPADLYLEGSDQHRGWFHTSLLHSVATRESAPYRSVLTHGFIVDGEGKKMSKSLGNVIAPQEIVGKYGAEILRLWVSAEDYKDDVRVSKEIIERLVEAYRKIRNTLRFLLGNLNDFDPEKHSVPVEKMLEIDKYLLHKLQELVKKIRNSYNEYLFHEVYHSIYNFCIVDLSSFYLDILKDRMYTFKRDSIERRSGQTAFYIILKHLTKLIAPVLSFTAEEVWQSMHFKEKRESVFLEDFPSAEVEYINSRILENWTKLEAVRGEVLKALEIKRKEKFIGSSLEACVMIESEGSIRNLLEEYRNFLPTLFIVSQVEVVNGIRDVVYTSEEFGLRIGVRHADGEKCERCWNYSPTVGKNPEHPTICARCVGALL